MGYVRDADITIEQVRRLARQLHYTELPAGSIHGSYAFLVETPEREIFGFLNVPAARGTLRGDLWYQKRAAIKAGERDDE